MPNWTRNTVTIKGVTPVAFTTQFCEENKERDLCVSTEKTSGVRVDSIPNCDFTNLRSDIEEWDLFPTPGSDRRFLFDGDVDYKKENLKEIIGESLFNKSPITKADLKKIDSKLEEWGGRGVNPLDWYSWNIAVLGTKWEFDIESIEETEDGGTKLICDTAWCSPVQFLETVAKRFNTTVHLEAEDEDLEWRHGPECETEGDEWGSGHQCGWEFENAFGCRYLIHDVTFYPDGSQDYEAKWCGEDLEAEEDEEEGGE